MTGMLNKNKLNEEVEEMKSQKIKHKNDNGSHIETFHNHTCN